MWTMKRVRGLLGQTDRAVVASVPDDFNLGKELSSARKVFLATAFARVSGWKLLQRDLLSGSAAIFLLTGLDFLQTEPGLLREWLRLTKRHSRVKAKIASRDSMFHPKVLVVEAGVRSRSFAIVGSGNLTSGGLCTNTECSLYTKDSAAIHALEHWFEEAWEKGTFVETAAIRKYEPKYTNARKAVQRIRSDQRNIQRDIEEIAGEAAANRVAILNDLRGAVAEFKRYSKKASFKRGYKERWRAVKQLQSLLNVPRFDFTDDDFRKFYDAPELGGLRERWREGILANSVRLKRGLKYLTDEDVPIEDRVNSFLGKRGRYRIPGFKIAGVSKILAASYPDRWPVLNGPVRKTLSHFQYEAPRGSPGERYRQFVEVAKQFDAPDFIALDAFFKYKEGELKLSGD